MNNWVWEGWGQGMFFVGKGSLLWSVFRCPLRMGLRPRTLPYPEVKSPHSLYQAHPLVWEYLSSLQARWVLCFCLKCVRHMVHCQPHCYICPPQRGDKVCLPWSFCYERGAWGEMPCTGLQERPAGHGKWNAYYWRWFSSVSSLCE